VAPSGHGFFSHRRKTCQTHRVAYEIATGKPIPRDAVVRHMCNVPNCCNPYHLKLGSVMDNIEDAKRNGPDFVLREEDLNLEYTNAQIERCILQSKLWSRIIFPANSNMFYKGCWLWEGRATYGSIWYDNRSHATHHVAYEMAAGEQLPD